MYVICDPYDSWACVARMWLVLCVYMRMICFMLPPCVEQGYFVCLAYVGG